MKQYCMRCGREREDTETVEVAKDAYTLCERCATTFYRRFHTFMAEAKIRRKHQFFLFSFPQIFPQNPYVKKAVILYISMN